MANPIQNPGLFDKIRIDGIENPGIARLQSGGYKNVEVDIQQQPGYIGAIAIFKKENLSKLVYRIELWRVEHFTAWRSYAAMLHAARKRKPKPRILPLVDPRVEHNDIKQVYVVGISAQQDLGGGRVAYDVELLEYKKPISLGYRPATGAVQDEFARANAVLEKAQKDADKLLEQANADYKAAANSQGGVVADALKAIGF
jgi:hypothetical protein